MVQALVRFLAVKNELKTKLISIVTCKISLQSPFILLFLLIECYNTSFDFACQSQFQYNLKRGATYKCFIKNALWKIHVKTIAEELLFHEVESLQPTTLLKMKRQHRFFACEFSEILQNKAAFLEQLKVNTSVNWQFGNINPSQYLMSLLWN